MILTVPDDAAIPPRIHRLSPQVANQIAAGEVIERPANVVKELVENSLDAGAHRISVTIVAGGRGLVEVIDDGCGIEAEDLALALERHATSKLTSAEDLFQVATLGFRGEALPSIASVSRFEMASRTRACQAGTQIGCDGGGSLVRRPCAMPPGTRVSVRDLFFNLPVRLKFLKTPAAEAGHVTDMVTRLALGHPQVAFVLKVDQRTALDLPAHGDLLDRIAACFEREFADGLLPLSAVRNGLQVTGFAGHPAQARPSTRRQYCFLNGRSIQDKVLIAALREGYQGFLEPRLHPSAIICIDCEPTAVDVNVHPTKHEVRFRDSEAVFQLVRQTLRDCLAQATTSSPFAKPMPARPTDNDPFAGVRRQVVHEAGASASPQPAPTSARISTGVGPGSWSPPAPSSTAPPSPALPPSDPKPASLPVAKLPVQESFLPHTVSDRSSQFYKVEEPSFASTVLPVGVRQMIQLDQSYILIETDQGIRIIDQHALHERLIQLCLDPAAPEMFRAGRQELLIPIPIAMSAAELVAVTVHLPRLAALGIIAEPGGSGLLLLRAHPPALARIDWAGLFAALAAEEPGPDALDRLRDHLHHRRACRAAVKAGTRLTPAEMAELVRLFLSVDGAGHCPHGRPTSLDLGWGELARRFQR